MFWPSFNKLKSFIKDISSGVQQIHVVDLFCRECCIYGSCFILFSDPFKLLGSLSTGKLSCLMCRKDSSSDIYRNSRTLCLEKVAETISSIKQLQNVQGKIF